MLQGTIRTLFNAIVHDFLLSCQAEEIAHVRGGAHHLVSVALRGSGRGINVFSAVKPAAAVDTSTRLHVFAYSISPSILSIE